MGYILKRRQLLFRAIIGLGLFVIFFRSLAAFAVTPTVDDQLLMITSDSCPWCEAFEQEIGVGYSLTEEGKSLPLRRHDFFEKMPKEFDHIEPAIMTPTFVVIRDNTEVGRIVGYPGSELFWWRLSEFFEN